MVLAPSSVFRPQFGRVLRLSLADSASRGLYQQIRRKYEFEGSRWSADYRLGHSVGRGVGSHGQTLPPVRVRHLPECDVGPSEVASAEPPANLRGLRKIPRIPLTATRPPAVTYARLFRPSVPKYNFDKRTAGQAVPDRPDEGENRMIHLASAAPTRPRGETIPPPASPERRMRNRWMARRAQAAGDAGRVDATPAAPPVVWERASIGMQERTAVPRRKGTFVSLSPFSFAIPYWWKLSKKCRSYDSAILIIDLRQALLLPERLPRPLR